MTVVQHTHHTHHKVTKISRLKIAIILTTAAMLLEFIGGLLSHSLALTSDAWHMLTHLFALGISYFALILSSQPITKKRTYGFYRAEVLGAFINGVVLIFVAFFIIYEAVLRFYRPQEIKIFEMLLVASIGFIVNTVTILLLFKASSHDDLNIRSAILHELGDIVSSVAVVAGGIFIYFTKSYLVDPILALFICVLIVIWSLKLLSESAHILLESTPKHLDIDELTRAVKEEIPGIYEVHHVHAWTIAPSMYSLTAHVVIGDCHLSTANEFLHKINKLLKERFNIEHANIQFECLVKK